MEVERVEKGTAKNSRGLVFGAALFVAVLIGGAAWVGVPKLGEGAKVAGATELIADPGSDDWQVREDPENVYTTSGVVTPNPADAPEDIPAYVDDDCQVRPGDTKVDPTCVYGDADGETTIALLGDSKMLQWFPAVESIADAEGWRLELYTKSACAFTRQGEIQECAEYNRNLTRHFESEGAPEIALVSQGGSDSPGLRSGIADAVTDLQSQGTEVLLFADSPNTGMSKVYACVEEHPDDYSACAFPAETGQGRAGRGSEVLKTAAEEAKAPFIDLNEWICPPGRECPPVIGDTLIYRQGTHVTATYMRTLTPMFYRGLAEQGLTRATTSEITADDVP